MTATSPQVAATRGFGRRRWLILAGCALLGTVIGIAAQRLAVPGPETAAAPAPSPRATAPVEAQIAGIAASGTSFTLRGKVWQSERYADANFGNLKKGVGLRLDLGTARQLTTVTFTAETGPLTAELRAGDSPERDGAAYQLVGSAVQATGPATLPASAGGRHRYWVIWVTRLPPSDPKARISNVVARG